MDDKKANRVGYEYLATDTTYNYDGVGNRTSVIDTGGTTNYTTNALNQYTAVGGVNYTYDDNGNLTYDGANAYSYDPEQPPDDGEDRGSHLHISHFGLCD